MNRKAILRGGVGLLLMLVLGAMYAWGYFKVALGAVYPAWSQTQITLNFTILMSAFCVAGVVAGNLNKVSKSVQVVIAALLVGAGFFGVSVLSADPGAALIQLYLCYGVLTGFGTGIAYNAVLSGIQPWFPSAPGVISGVLLMGMGFGSLILGNVAAALLKVVSLSTTFRIFSLGTLVILLACAALVRPPREGEVEKKTVAQQSDGEGRCYTTAEMLRRPTFWLYFIWNIMFSASGALVINSASSISLFYGLAAVVGLLVSVFNGLGRLFIGNCMDRLGWKKTMYLNNICLLLAGALLLAGDRSASGAIVVVGMLLVGMCYGGGITISAALIRALYGSKHYASNFAVSNLCVIPGAILGPMLSAALQDNFGGYFATFVMVLFIGVVAMGLNFFIRKP